MFIVHGGDMIPLSNNNSEVYKNLIYNSTHIIKKYFPDTPLIYTLGNHDAFPY